MNDSLRSASVFLSPARPASYCGNHLGTIGHDKFLRDRNTEPELLRSVLLDKLLQVLCVFVSDTPLPVHPLRGSSTYVMTTARTNI
jgi:hypothetical protein